MMMLTLEAHRASGVLAHVAVKRLQSEGGANQTRAGTRAAAAIPWIANDTLRREARFDTVREQAYTQQRRDAHADR